MPNKDGTGPDGKGPLPQDKQGIGQGGPGRGLGRGRGQGLGKGRGQGRGLGKGLRRRDGSCQTPKNDSSS